MQTTVLQNMIQITNYTESNKTFKNAIQSY